MVTGIWVNFSMTEDIEFVIIGFSFFSLAFLFDNRGQWNLFFEIPWVGMPSDILLILKENRFAEYEQPYFP